MLDDILALSDITEVESHRLSELCRIFTALEGLFVDDLEQVCRFNLAFMIKNSSSFRRRSLLLTCRYGSNSRIYPSFWYSRSFELVNGGRTVSVTDGGAFASVVWLLSGVRTRRMSEDVAASERYSSFSGKVAGVLVRRTGD